MKKAVVVPLVFAMASVLVGVIGVHPAIAAPCPAAAPPGTVFNGNVNVWPGSPCSLNDVKILGSLIVPPGAFASVSNSDIAFKASVGDGGRLILDNTSVGTDVVAKNSQSVELYSVLVGKSVRSIGSTSGTFAVCDSVIDTHLYDTGVTSPDTPNRIGDPAVGCKGNTVGGQIVLSGNAAQGIIKANTGQRHQGAQQLLGYALRRLEQHDHKCPGVLRQRRGSDRPEQSGRRQNRPVRRSVGSWEPSPVLLAAPCDRRRGP